MAAARKAKTCSECGAELRLGPAPCPLCGHDHGSADAKSDDWTRPGDADGYQATVRDLRDELKKLRDEGAEAV